MAHAYARALAQSKGDRHFGYAATIARAFSAIDRKELESYVNNLQKVSSRRYLDELNTKKKNDGVKQSNPLHWINQQTDDDNPPIKFYDGETIETISKWYVDL